MKKTLSTLLLICLCGMVAAQRTNLRDNMYIGFEPNHADWTYKCGEDAKIEVSVRRHFCPVPNVVLHCQWGPDQREAEQTFDVNVGKSGVEMVTLKGAKQPGFKTLEVTAEVDGKKVYNLIKIAFSPEKLKPTSAVPTDFQSYWDGVIEKARKVPLAPLFTRRAEYDNAYCDAYEVRFQNLKAGSYMYGMLAVPKGVNPTDTIAARKYPAVILWPGAGVKSHFGDVGFFPERGVITLEMGIHGIPVTLPDHVYKNLESTALNGYSRIYSPERDDYYYRTVYVGTVKTMDFLCSLPCVDATRIGCYGGSQGGALSTITAALDSRVKCAAISYPALAEIAGYGRGRADGWPHLFRTQNPDEALMKVADYYDVVNFSRLVNCKVLFFLGFNDIVCCPTSTYSAYNVIPGEKELITMQEAGHWMHAEYHQMRREWLLEQLSR